MYAVKVKHFHKKVFTFLVFGKKHVHQNKRDFLRDVEENLPNSNRRENNAYSSSILVKVFANAL